MIIQQKDNNDIIVHNHLEHNDFIHSHSLYYILRSRGPVTQWGLSPLLGLWQFGGLHHLWPHVSEPAHGPAQARGPPASLAGCRAAAQGGCRWGGQGQVVLVVVVLVRWEFAGVPAEGVVVGGSGLWGQRVNKGLPILLEGVQYGGQAGAPA